MTFLAREITIGTTAVAIATATSKNTHEITIGNDYNKDIYIGASDVTVGTGYGVSKSVHVTFRIANGDILYAISNAAGSNIHVFDFQVDP